MGEAGNSSQPDWANLSVLHRNTLSPRSSFFLYNTAEDAISRNTSNAKAQKLSGKWKFHLANSPFEAPSGFETTAYDSSQWHEVQVPGMWQLQGFGKGPHYTNVQFPFFVDPPHPPFYDNECGSYLTYFRVPEHLQGHQLRLRFEGVDSGFHVWLNGKEVGYSQGARNPSEWDVTDCILPNEENLLAVRVYQFTDGSYIEDQDQWWLSGIFRDVFLLGFPKKARFEDISIVTDLDSDYKDATLRIDAQVHGLGTVKAILLDSSNKEIAASEQTAAESNTGTMAFSISVSDPHKWTAETPYLYTLVLSLNDDQHIAQRIGFRKIELKDGLIKVNGRRVVFKGANRHEHHPTLGRAVPYDFMRNDLILMKTHNLNAVRTSHQPSDTRLYDLADEIGLWVMNEADLECHGFETIADAALPPDQQALPFFERQKLTRAEAAKWVSDNAAWKEAYLDRAKHLVHRDKLHPSVIIWSLGNEAFYGQNHTAMRDWIKAYDPTRLIHYEPDLEAKHMDMHSRMYPHVSEIIKFGQDESKVKPLVLCEYIHAMGTGPGNIKEYVDAFYKYEKLQGGFVWEWANHGLLTKSKTGKIYYGYGGVFGDHPNDSNFVMDGVLSSDHLPRSALIEYKKALEPVQLLSQSAKTVTIINRLDFDTLDHLECVWQVSAEGETPSASGSKSIPHGIGPGNSAELQLPDTSLDASKETFIDLSFRLKKSTSWGEAGHEVALIQVPMTKPSAIEIPTSAQDPKLEVDASPTTLSIKGPTSHWQLDLVRGRLTFWKKSDIDILSKPLEPTFYRAPTDNDAPRDGKDWKDKLLHLATLHTRKADWRANSDGFVSVTLLQKFAPPVLSWSLDLSTEYRFSPSGAVEVHVKGVPAGQNLPLTLPRSGVTLSLPKEFQNVKWYGRGPGESYKDMKLSQPVSLHSVSSISSLWKSPEFPQESSNRTDTRWLEISSPETSLKVQFLKSNGSTERKLFDFMASHYDVKDIEEARHPYELEERKKEEVVLRLDADHHGLGTGSCGPKTLEEYALKTQPFEFTLLLH